MSGGYFDYQDNRIDDMMDIIKHDIKYNDVDWSYTSETGEPVVDCGFQHSKETIDIFKKIVKRYEESNGCFTCILLVCIRRHL